MEDDVFNFYKNVNYTRFRFQTAGHYESYFLRANHPDRPLAFWIRYTIFSPKDHLADAIGELWAVLFNGETEQHIPVKQEVPFRLCAFSTDSFEVRVGDALLEAGIFKGGASERE